MPRSVSGSVGILLSQQKAVLRGLRYVLDILRWTASLFHGGYWRMRGDGRLDVAPKFHLTFKLWSVLLCG